MMNHFAENLRYKPLVKYIPLDKDICEIGINRRVWLLENLKPSNYMGIDINPEIVDSCLETYSHINHRVDFYQYDLEVDPDDIGWEQFDFILSVATIEHILQIYSFLNNIHYILRDDGTALITTPTPFGNFIHGILSKLGILNINAYRDHCIIFSGYRLKRTVKKCGFKVLKYKRYTLGMNQMILIAKA